MGRLGVLKFEMSLRSEEEGFCEGDGHGCCSPSIFLKCLRLRSEEEEFCKGDGHGGCCSRSISTISSFFFGLLPPDY